MRVCRSWADEGGVKAAENTPLHASKEVDYFVRCWRRGAGNNRRQTRDGQGACTCAQCTSGTGEVKAGGAKAALAAMRNEHGYRGSERHRQGAVVEMGCVGFGVRTPGSRRAQNVPWLRYGGGVSGRSHQRMAALLLASRPAKRCKQRVSRPGRRRRRLGPCQRARSRCGQGWTAGLLDERRGCRRAKVKGSRSQKPKQGVEAGQQQPRKSSTCMRPYTPASRSPAVHINLLICIR